MGNDIRHPVQEYINICNHVRAHRFLNKWLESSNNEYETIKYMKIQTTDNINIYNVICVRTDTSFIEKEFDLYSLVNLLKELEDLKITKLKIVENASTLELLYENKSK